MFDINNTLYTFINILNIKKKKSKWWMYSLDFLKCLIMNCKIVGICCNCSKQMNQTFFFFKYIFICCWCTTNRIHKMAAQGTQCYKCLRNLRYILQGKVLFLFKFSTLIFGHQQTDRIDSCVIHGCFSSLTIVTECR